ncbi:MAG TPA: hypothetical protein PLX35_04580 [Cyclobacteriaceae bacterium]|nr:hypothetical protein [Cyclobacteriaceae bacterium]
MNKWILCLVCLVPALTGNGQDIPNATLVRKSDSQTVLLSECVACAGVVVIFTSPDCPFDGYYAERLQLLRDRYAGQVSFYFIDPAESAVTNPSTPFSSLTLYTDNQQQLSKILDPHKTPEAFLLKKQNTKLTLVYRGAIDDNPQMASAVTQPWLQSAIDNLLEGRAPAQSEVRASGCTIRRK